MHALRGPTSGTIFRSCGVWRGAPILELGVRGGNSTAALLAGLEDSGGTLWSVDIDPASARSLTVILSGGLSSPIVVMRPLSWPQGFRLEVDVLFIDTIHTLEQVRDELAVWGDRVKKDGLILFHDTDSFPEIRPAISGWCEQRRIPFQFLEGSNGLGVAYPGRSVVVFAARSWALRRGRSILQSTRRLGRVPPWVDRAAATDRVAP
jgi:Methyltransferase domain